MFFYVVLVASQIHLSPLHTQTIQSIRLQLWKSQKLNLLQYLRIVPNHLRHVATILEFYPQELLCRFQKKKKRDVPQLILFLSIYYIVCGLVWSGINFCFDSLCYEMLFYDDKLLQKFWTTIFWLWQALLYRLSGDYNPLHSDPMIAKVAGLVHYLCWGYLCWGYGYWLHYLTQLLCILNFYTDLCFPYPMFIDFQGQFCMDCVPLGLQYGLSSNVFAGEIQTWSKASLHGSFCMCILVKHSSPRCGLKAWGTLLLSFSNNIQVNVDLMLVL